VSFRAWGPRQNLVYALSVGSTVVDATVPIGFASGDGQCIIYNSGATDVLVAFYKNTDGAPALTFPVTGAPPVGQGVPSEQHAVATVVPKGARIQVSIPLSADSFAAIGSATGPSIIYVQKGTGSV